MQSLLIECVCMGKMAFWTCYMEKMLPWSKRWSKCIWRQFDGENKRGVMPIVKRDEKLMAKKWFRRKSISKFQIWIQIDFIFRDFEIISTKFKRKFELMLCRFQYLIHPIRRSIDKCKMVLWRRRPQKLNKQEIKGSALSLREKNPNLNRPKTKEKQGEKAGKETNHSNLSHRLNHAKRQWRIKVMQVHQMNIAQREIGRSIEWWAQKHSHEKI